MEKKITKLIVIAMGIIAWAVILPLLMLGATIFFHSEYNIYSDIHDLYRLVPGVIVLAAGIWVALWSIYAQYAIGEGTPVPLLPAVKLVVKGPYRYCRNPMALGVILMLSGAAIALWSIPALVIAVVISLLHVLYDKIVEEKELEKRFGDEYTRYKQETPFIFPGILSIKKK
ncbi:MAG: methyltransferase family protein [Spirochaetota bacterium]